MSNVECALRGSLLAEFVRRAGGAEARIVVIPSASAEPVRRAEQYSRIFRELGAACVRAVHAERGASPDDLLLIENATGIFVAGGDQELLMRHLRRNGCAEVIVDTVRRGAVYCGTSAGAAVVSKKMLFQRDDDMIAFAEGLGLVPTVIVDQHFSERGRMARLASAVDDHGLTGVGIDENTAAVWESGAMIRVAGESRVTVIKPGERVRRAAHGESVVL